MQCFVVSLFYVSAFDLLDFVNPFSGFLKDNQKMKKD